MKLSNYYYETFIKNFYKCIGERVAPTQLYPPKNQKRKQPKCRKGKIYKNEFSQKEKVKK